MMRKATRYSCGQGWTRKWERIGARSRVPSERIPKQKRFKNTNATPNTNLWVLPVLPHPPVNHLRRLSSADHIVDTVRHCVVMVPIRLHARLLTP